MAHILVKNSLSNLKAAKVDVNFVVYTSTDSNGDPIWLLESATTYPPASGVAIRPVYTNKIGALESLDDVVDTSISKIASQIDWGTLEKDDNSPFVIDIRPLGGSVSIASNIYIDIKDDVPSAGIDLSEMKVILTTGNTEFDITNDCVVAGDPFYYNIHWSPPARITRHYEKE